MKPTCGLRHAPLSDVFAPWDPTAFRAGLLPVFVAPLPVWVGLKVGLFYLGTGGGTEIKKKTKIYCMYYRIIAQKHEVVCRSS